MATSGGSSARAAPLVRRQEVPPGRPYDAYRQALREDFWWSCAYCSITEVEARGIGFELDHYEPRAHGGSDEYGNLMYACQHCNRKKEAWFASEARRELGYYIIRIDEEDPATHLQLHSSNAELSARTETGEHNILVLDLNRRALQRLRRFRAERARPREVIAHGLRVLASFRLDELPKSARAEVAKHRALLEREFGEALDDSDARLRALCRSELLDVDDDKRARARKRRAHLASLEATLPAPPAVRRVHGSKRRPKKRRR